MNCTINWRIKHYSPVLQIVEVYQECDSILQAKPRSNEACNTQ